MFRAGISEPDHGDVFRTFVLGGQAKMLPPTLFEKVPTPILLVTALHDDYLGARFRVVHTRGHRDVPPVDCVLACGVGFNLVYLVRVVTDDPVATLARDRAPDGSREPVTRAVVIKAALCVL